MRFDVGKPLHLTAPSAYEDALLSSLAFFRKQPREKQALNCLSMYLRQSEERVMGEIGFYAQMVGIEPHELLMLIHTDPNRAEELLDGKLKEGLSED